MARTLRHLLLSSMLASLALAPTALAQAPGYATPKTSWGVPDLHGFWSSQSYTHMERREPATKLVVTEAEEQELLKTNTYTRLEADEAGASDVSKEASEELLADKNPNRGYNRFWMDPGSGYARVKGEIRTSWIVDPPDGQPPRKARSYGRSRNGNDYSYETRPLMERCIQGFTNSSGPVLDNGLYNNNYQIVQSPTHVMILGEMIHDARVIPIVKSKVDVKHDSPVLQKWQGDGVGWYEGNTLVIETTNINPKQNVYASETGKVTERFTRWDDKQIFYEFTVDDPSLYTQVWKGEMSLNWKDQPVYEYACHEGNYGIENALRGTRRFQAEGRKEQYGPRTFGELGEE